MNFKDIEKSRKLLELPEEATMKEIKNAYRKLAVKYHPDTCKESNKKHCAEMFRKITESYEIISNYIVNYKISFRKEEVRKNLDEEKLYEYMKGFYDDW